MEQQRKVPLLMVIIDFFILGYSAFTIFTGGEAAGRVWFIYLLTYVIGDALMGLQVEKNRPLNVVELTFATQKTYPVITVLSFIQRLCDFGLLILLIASLFTQSTWSFLAGLSLVRIILYVFALIGINYRFNQWKK